MKILLKIMLLVLLSENSFSRNETSTLEISPLEKGIYLHKSYKNIKGYGLVGSNGLVVLDKGKAYIIDTPWSTEDTKKLVNWIKDQGHRVEGSISTHSHEDRTKGVSYLNTLSIPTYTSDLTNRILKEKGEETAKYTFSNSGYSLGSGLIEIFHPGAGHTIDNLVVWLPNSKVLFGGCLVRSLSDNNLGYVGEASIDTWERSIDKLITKYPEAKLVVPGHGLPGNIDLLRHTKHLAKTGVD